MTTGNKYEKKNFKGKNPSSYNFKSSTVNKTSGHMCRDQGRSYQSVTFEQGAKGVTHVVIWEDF